MALWSSFLDLELVEDRLRLGVTRLRLPLRAQPLVDLVEAIVGVEDPAHHELWRHRAVPVVLLQAERHVIAGGAPVAVELRPLTKGDRASRVSAVSVHAETEMLPLSHR